MAVLDCERVPSPPSTPVQETEILDQFSILELTPAQETQTVADSVISALQNPNISETVPETIELNLSPEVKENITNDVLTHIDAIQEGNLSSTPFTKVSRYYQESFYRHQDYPNFELEIETKEKIDRSRKMNIRILKVTKDGDLTHIVIPRSTVIELEGKYSTDYKEEEHQLYLNIQEKTDVVSGRAKNQEVFDIVLANIGKDPSIQTRLQGIANDCIKVLLTVGIAMVEDCPHFTGDGRISTEGFDGRYYDNFFYTSGVRRLFLGDAFPNSYNSSIWVARLNMRQAIRETVEIATQPLPSVDLEVLFDDQRDLKFAELIIDKLEEDLTLIKPDEVPAQARMTSIQPSQCGPNPIRFTREDRPQFEKVLEVLKEQGVVKGYHEKHWDGYPSLDSLWELAY